MTVSPFFFSFQPDCEETTEVKLVTHALTLDYSLVKYLGW